MPQFDSHPEKWHSEHATVLHPRGRQCGTGEEQRQFVVITLLDIGSAHVIYWYCAQVEDEVDEINAKVFSELERKINE